MFIMDKTQVHYIDSVQMSGGIPITLPVLEHFDTNIIRSQINLVDGILIQGGVDVTPSLYGEEPVPELDITSKQTDEYILEIIKYAIDRKIPILGICKGMQMINVYFGGTLYQDLKYAGIDGKLHKQTKETITETFHSINVEKNSLLSKIIPNKDKLNVNSYHHQAIKKLGKNIIIDAKADDGVIECIYYNSNNQWILGVQFHPEQLIRKREKNIKLASVLRTVSEAVKNRAKNWKEIVTKISKKYPADIVEALNIIGNSKDKESEEYTSAIKLIDAKINNLEGNLHIEIDMERIEDRSKALSYIGIEIAEALKYIPALPEEIENIETEVAQTVPVQNVVVNPIVQQNVQTTVQDFEEESILPISEEINNTTVVEVGTQNVQNTVNDLYFEETRFEARPTLWQKIKNSKFVRTIKYIMQIRVVLDYPALPEGRGNNY